MNKQKKEPLEIQDGKTILVFDEPFETYREHEDFASQSTLEKYKKSPLHALHEEFKETEALRFGRLYHEFILTPEEFVKNYYLADDTKLLAELSQSYVNPVGTKAYKSWFAEQLGFAKGKEIVTSKDFIKMQSMRQELMKYTFIRYLLKATKKEVSAYGEIDGIKAKGRFDMYLEKKRWIVDLKTVSDASEDGFTYYLKNFNGHLQPALYTQLAEQAHDDGLMWKFYWIAQEKEKPYAVAIYRASPQIIAVGIHEVGLLIKEWEYCHKNNQYDGYEVFVDNDFGIREISLPPYAIKDYQFFNK